MPRLQFKSFATPDEDRRFPMGNGRIVKLDESTVGHGQLGARLALVDASRADRRDRLVPGPPSGLRDLGAAPRRHGRRPVDRDPAGFRVRDPGRPRRKRGRRRTIRDARMDERPHRRGRRAGGDRTRPRDRPVHRHRRLDGDPRTGSATRPGASSSTSTIAVCGTSSIAIEGARSTRPATGSWRSSTARRGRWRAGSRWSRRRGRWASRSGWACIPVKSSSSVATRAAWPSMRPRASCHGPGPTRCSCRRRRGTCSRARG